MLLPMIHAFDGDLLVKAVIIIDNGDTVRAKPLEPMITRSFLAGADPYFLSVLKLVITTDPELAQFDPAERINSRTALTGALWRVSKDDYSAEALKMTFDTSYLPPAVQKELLAIIGDRVPALNCWSTREKAA